MTSSSRRLVPGGRPRRPALAGGAATLIGPFPSPVPACRLRPSMPCCPGGRPPGTPAGSRPRGHGALALLACLYSAHCDEYKPYPRRKGVTMADAATAEPTEETAVTGPV